MPTSLTVQRKIKRWLSRKLLWEGFIGFVFAVGTFFLFVLTLCFSLITYFVISLMTALMVESVFELCGVSVPFNVWLAAKISTVVVLCLVAGLYFITNRSALEQIPTTDLLEPPSRRLIIAAARMLSQLAFYPFTLLLTSCSLLQHSLRYAVWNIESCAQILGILCSQESPIELPDLQMRLKPTVFSSIAALQHLPGVVFLPSARALTLTAELRAELASVCGNPRLARG